MIQDDVKSVLGFFNRINRARIIEPTLADNLAKLVGVPLPDSLKGATIDMAEKNHRRGKHSFTLTTLKYPSWAWAFSWLAKTKCYLICVGEGEHIHCVHICVSCFDGFPGPGCYLHGSYD